MRPSRRGKVRGGQAKTVKMVKPELRGRKLLTGWLQVNSRPALGHAAGDLLIGDFSLVDMSFRCGFRRYPLEFRRDESGPSVVVYGSVWRR